MNFIIFSVLVDIYYAQNPNNSYYSKNQGLPDQQFLESMKIYPDKLDALLKARIWSGIESHREYQKFQDENLEKSVLEDYNKLVPAFSGENESIINLDVDLFWMDTMRPT